MARSSAPADLAYRALPAPGPDARDLFAFVGAWAPADTAVDCGWGAWDGARLVGALLLERAGAAAMLHGPVVVTGEASGGAEAEPLAASSGEAVEVAARLVEQALAHASAHGIETLFTRPQGLDPVWVRFGFIPVPEVELPRGLRDRPGLGLFAWRGGTALWSAAARGGGPPGSRRR